MLRRFVAADHLSPQTVWRTACTPLRSLAVGQTQRPIQILQVGRALAAIAVVLSHAAIAAHDFGSDFVGRAILEFGFLGVDFFFVLSGFIIYHSTVKSGKRPFSYAEARLGRIFAPYLPIGIAMGLLYSLELGPGAQAHWDWPATLTLMPFGAPALSVAWTLQHELSFYAIFGLLHFCGILRTGLLVWAAGIVFCAILPGPDFIPLRLINLEFLFGILAAHAVRAAKTHRLLFPASATILAAWLVAGASRDSSWLVGLAIALLLPAMVQAEERGKIRAPRALVFLGAASYSIYLAHSMAISIVGRVLAGNWWLILIAGTLAGVAAGVAYHLAIERPLMKLWRHLVVERAARLVATDAIA